MINRLYVKAIPGVVACVLLVLPCALFAEDVPAVINYQGRLSDNMGVPVTAGYYHIEFRIWDSPTQADPANLIWGRMFPVHVMAEGVFNILLSDDVGLLSPAPQVDDLRDAFEGEDRYLGLTITVTPAGSVAGPAEISPRQRLVSAPYTFHAQHASYAAEAAEGFRVEGGLVVASGGAEITGDVSVSENVQVQKGVAVGAALAVAGSANVGAGMTVHGPASIMNNLDIVGHVNVDDAYTISGHGTIPIGGIILWHGVIGDIPDGWALCDGGMHDGQVTPDLRDRFVVGAGKTYPENAIGGAKEVTLTVDQMPNHAHTYTAYKEKRGYHAVESDDGYYWTDNKNWTATSAGGSQPHENRPPYYALCYIMRVK